MAFQSVHAVSSEMCHCSDTRFCVDPKNSGRVKVFDKYHVWSQMRTSKTCCSDYVCNYVWLYWKLWLNWNLVLSRILRNSTSKQTQQLYITIFTCRNDPRPQISLFTSRLGEKFYKVERKTYGKRDSITISCDLAPSSNILRKIKCSNFRYIHVLNMNSGMMGDDKINALVKFSRILKGKLAMHKTTAPLKVPLVALTCSIKSW